MEEILNTIEVARKVVDALEDKKGENIVLLDIQEVASFADYFVVASGTSDRMLNSLGVTIQEIDRSRKLTGRGVKEKPRARSGPSSTGLAGDE